jgi:hypothetical protein
MLPPLPAARSFTHRRLPSTIDTSMNASASRLSAATPSPSGASANRSSGPGEKLSAALEPANPVVKRPVPVLDASASRTPGSMVKTRSPSGPGLAVGV